MKINLNIIKKRLDIKGFLIANYLITFLILYIIIQLSYKSSSFILEKFIFKSDQVNNVPVYSYYNKDFDKINLGVISQMGGWEEVLDENKKVIYVKGEKKDTTMQYTEKQLFELTSLEKNPTETPYIGEVFSVEGKNGERYIFLFKVDRKKISHPFMYKPNFYSKADAILSIKSYGTLYLIQFIYLLIGIYIYSVISAKFITTPLKNFVCSIKSFKKLDYGTRTNIEGLKELREVEKEFNDMVIKLQKTKEENEKIDKSKKRLLVDISHDLKTPITSIQGFSKLLLEENITEEEKNKFLKIIYNKAIYSAALIEDLFDLSKLEDSEYSLSLEKLDFSEWLRRLVVEYYEEFKRKNFNLVLNISEYAILLNFDKKLMKRAISNIFNNALKYNNDNTTLRIECFTKNDNLIVEIGNNGEAIDKGIRDTIFKPFVKNESETSDGSGLGLAITKKVVEKHGGTIKLTFTESDNNLFHICIPLKL